MIYKHRQYRPVSESVITSCIVVLSALVIGMLASSAHATSNPPISTLCIEADTGLVLSESHADLLRPPASMVKMVMLLMVAEGIEDGRWTLDQSIRISARTEAITGSRIGMKEGEVFSLEDLIQAVAVGSANDGANAVAEGLWGSADAYLDAANRRALELGMPHTRFYSPHGLPPDDDTSFDRSTARDMAILAQWCVRNTYVMKWVSLGRLQLRNGEYSRQNTNRLLQRVSGCDGLKTGYTITAGYCLTATAQRNGIRLIAVVMGHPNSEGRFDLTQRILESGFNEIGIHIAARKGQEVGQPVPVLNSSAESIRLAVAHDVELKIREADLPNLNFRVMTPRRLRAPLYAGEIVGRADIMLFGHQIGQADLIVQHNVERISWRDRMLLSARRRH